MSRAANLQLSFADWEFLRQGVVLERELQAIADFLDEHEEMVEAIRGDLHRGLKNPNTGRKGLTPQQVLRSLILMRIKNWDYRELRERIDDGLTLRRFADFNAQPVPKHDAFQRAFSRVTPQTLRLVNEQLITAAVAMGLEDGGKLRVDTTVVQTDIHHPTDNTLLWVIPTSELPTAGYCRLDGECRSQPQWCRPAACGRLPVPWPPPPLSKARSPVVASAVLPD